MTLQPTRLCSTGNGRRHSTNSQSITPMSMETAATNTPSRLGRSRTQTNSARWRHFSGGPPGPPARIGRSAEVTYTQNWPHEELIGNRPTGAAVVWSVISFVLLLAGVGGMVWYFASQQHAPSSGVMPHRDPLRVEAYAFAKSYSEILLCRRCALGGAGRIGSDRRPLRGRGRRILRHSIGEVVAVFSSSDVAPADRHFLDRHFMARHWLIHRSRSERHGAAGTTIRC